MDTTSTALYFGVRSVGVEKGVFRQDITISKGIIIYFWKSIILMLLREVICGNNVPAYIL